MDENIDMAKTFDAMDEADLAMVLNQVSRRMIVLRAGTPDAAFWYNVIKRVSRVLNSAPVLTDKEKQLLANPPKEGNSRIQVIKGLRQRTGMRLQACKDVVDKWVADNLPTKGN